MGSRGRSGRTASARASRPSNYPTGPSPDQDISDQVPFATKYGPLCSGLIAILFVDSTEAGGIHLPRTNLRTLPATTRYRCKIRLALDGRLPFFSATGHILRSDIPSQSRRGCWKIIGWPNGPEQALSHDGTSLLYSKLEDFVDMNLMAFILPFKEI